jgi:hypothetical protein
MGGGEKAGFRYRTITDGVVNLYSFLWKCCIYSANQEIPCPYETRRIITTLPKFLLLDSNWKKFSIIQNFTNYLPLTYLNVIMPRRSRNRCTVWFLQFSQANCFPISLFVLHASRTSSSGA